jgi:hypothetical protein
MNTFATYYYEEEETKCPKHNWSTYSYAKESKQM